MNEAEWWVGDLEVAAKVLCYLDGQGGDAGLQWRPAVADAHVYAVVLGVVQAEWARHQDEGRRPVCIEEED